MRTALIYRDTLLPISETFIVAQSNSLRSYLPQFIGLRSVDRSLPGIGTPVLLTRGHSLRDKLRVAAYRVTGRAPDFHERAKAVHADLIHAHFAIDATNALCLAEHLQLPLVVTLHGFDVTIRDEARRREVAGALFLHRRRKLWQRADLFLCVSEFIRQQAITSGYPKAKLRVHHIGVDTGDFPRTSHPRESIILFVGRLVEKKGCEYLVRAMRTVQERCTDSTLVVIGEGPLRRKLEELANLLKVNVQFLGAQPAAQVRAWLQRVKVVCAPSVTARNGDSEGLPIVLLEAQASGVPTVASRHAGIADAVIDGKTGLLAGERNYSELATHLIRYLSDEDFWERSSEAASFHVASYFSLQRQTEYLERLYDELLDTHYH